MQTIEHKVKVIGRKVASVEPPTIVSNNQAIDTLRFELDSSWDGFDLTTAVLHRANVNDVELELDTTNPVVKIPATHICEI